MIEKRRRKRHGSHIFLITLILTIALGSVVLGCSMIWAVGSPQLVVVKLESQLANLVEDVQAAESVLASAQSAKPVGKYDALLADEALCRQQNIYAKTAASPNETTIVFAGDILFDDHYAVKVKMNQRGRGIEGSISQEMLDVMRSADIFMVNNEFPYSDRGTPTENKKFTFRAKPEYASYLLDMGADIVSLANNHAYDYGKIAFLDTLDTLNGIGMPYVGAGRNLEEAIKPVYFIVNDQKIAFVAATQIERTENPDTKVSDYVIVYIHWGTEATDQLDWAQKDQAVKISNAGADLIIGDHPHVLQQFGYCEDTPVMYSLGNFLFNSKAQDTCLVKLTLDANGFKSLQFIPGRQQDCSVTMLHGTEKERVLSYMRKISPGVTIDGDGFVTKKG